MGEAAEIPSKNLKDLGWFDRAKLAFKTAQLVIEGVDNNTWMGPLNPLRPFLPYVEGRQFDYNTGYNINYIPRGRNAGRASFAELRNLSINCELARIVIETRKDQVCALHWQIKPSEDNPTAPDPDNDPIIKELTQFFESPDKEHDWDDWLRVILEELFVTDAVSLYKFPTKGGGLYALEYLDGTTIFPLIDEAGRRPKFPNPAYQQILKGTPKINYTTAELLYKPRNLRVYSTYGYSPLEQIIISCRMDIERAKLQLAYFTEGSTPDIFMTMDTQIPIEAVRGWERNFNEMMSGNAAERRRVPFMPAGTKAEMLKQPPLKDEFDEWIARKVCFAFSIPPNAFTKQMNRASAESEHDRALEEGLEPIKKWIKKLIDGVIKNDLKIQGYEFAWADDREQDPAIQDTIVVNDTKAAVITINEARAMKGLDPDPSPEADMLMVCTATGYVPLTQYQDAQDNQAANMEIQRTKAENPAPVVAGGKEGGKQSDQQKFRSDQSRAHQRYLDQPVDTPSRMVTVATRKDAAYSGLRKAVRPKAIPFSRPTTEEAITVLAGKVTHALEKTRNSVVKQLKNKFVKVQKSDEDDAEAIASALDLSDLDSLADVTTEELKAIAKEAGLSALIQIGVGNNSDLVNQVNKYALQYAKDRGAELIGKRWQGDELVDNPDAVWRIDETTRGAVADSLEDLFSGKITHTEFYDQVSASPAFGSARAEMIARTEISLANGGGSLAAYKISKANGSNIKKEWIADDEACPECLENEAAGAIDLEDEFPSGDDAPTAHPNCECALSPVIIDGETDEEATADESDDE